MTLGTNLRKFLVVVLAGIALTSCATQGKKGSQLSGCLLYTSDAADE